ncbi:hypothetical protein LXL04_033960 [Taraxacum kok-saghyz]
MESTKTQESRELKRKEDISNAIHKEHKDGVEKYICRWAIESTIPFNSFETNSFKMILEAVRKLDCGRVLGNSGSTRKG